MQHLNDNELVTQLKNLVARERALVREVLEYLREVELRKIYLARGYSSLFGFCMEFLGYSENEAQVRIQAMRLIKAVPEVVNKIENGELSLTVAAKAGGAFRREKTPALEQKQILASLENKSVREAERELAILFPQLAKPEMTKPINGEQVELRLTISKEMYEDIELLKSLFAHKNYGANTSDLLKELIHLAKEKFQKQGKIPIAEVGDGSKDKQKTSQCQTSLGKILRKPASQNKFSQQSKSIDQPEACASAHKSPWSTKVKTNCASILNNPREKAPSSLPQPLSVQSRPIAKEKFSHQNPSSRYIPRATARQIWQRDQAKCQYIDPQTKKRCLSKHALEIDHIIPHSQNGSAAIKNLRLLCDKHNRWRAAHSK